MPETDQLLGSANVVPEALQRFARAAADFATHGKLGKLEFAQDARGRPDVAAFDFTSMMRAESSARVQEKHGARLLLGLVGDCLVEVSISGGIWVPWLGWKLSGWRWGIKFCLLWEEFGEGRLMEVKAVGVGKGLLSSEIPGLGHTLGILTEWFPHPLTPQPFWPLGTGVARGFLAAFDAAWMVKRWAEGAGPLEVLAER